MPKRALIAAALIAAAAIAAVLIFTAAGSHKRLPLPSAANMARPAACHPAPNQGHLGVCAPHQINLTRPLTAALPPNQGLFPDVYEGDAVYSWSTAAPHIVGAIVKAYEYRQDSRFASNWDALRALHLWHSAYIFLHSSCSAVYSFMAVVNAHGGFNQPETGPPVIDAETPDAASAVGCAVAITESMTHRAPIIYTAPGTWPGGDHGNAWEWAAGYGNYSHSPCIWTCNPIGWQYTDGTYGPFPHQIPGIQPGDISVSYGIQRLVVNARPPGPTRSQIGQHVARKRHARDRWNARHCGDHTTWGDCARFRAAVVGAQDWLQGVAGYPPVACWGAHARPGEAVCVVLRPSYATDLRLAEASRQAYWGNHCRRHPRRGDCVADAHTTAYRNAQAARFWRKYGP